MYQKCVLISKFISGYRKLEDHIVEVSWNMYHHLTEFCIESLLSAIGYGPKSTYGLTQHMPIFMYFTHQTLLDKIKPGTNII